MKDSKTVRVAGDLWEDAREHAHREHSTIMAVLDGWIRAGRAKTKKRAA